MTRQRLKALVLFITLAMMMLLAGCSTSDNKTTEESSDDLSYSDVFDQCVLSEGIEKPGIEYGGKDMLRNCSIDGPFEWTDNLVPSKYKSRSPNDLGGIIIFSEETRIVANYMSKEGGAASGYRTEYTIKIIDPFNGILVDTNEFVPLHNFPTETYKSVYLRPDDKFVTDWIEEAWDKYLEQGKAKPTYEYTVDDNGVNITGYEKRLISSEAVIPDEIDGKSVIAIGDSVFYACSRLTSISIPNSVTAIDQDAFQGCDGLVDIALPDNLVYIGKGAFQNCRNLKAIALPNSVTSIGENAFSYCVALTDITLPGRLVSIGRFAFCDCESLKKIVLPDSYTHIDDAAFYNCTGLVEITLPEALISIGESAFYNCNRLRSIALPDSLVSIGDGAFNTCEALSEITLPDGVAEIGRLVFFKCSSLTDITVPDSLISIGEEAFGRVYNENLIIHCSPNSYTAGYCKENSYPYDDKR